MPSTCSFYFLASPNVCDAVPPHHRSRFLIFLEVGHRIGLARKQRPKFDAFRTMKTGLKMEFHETFEYQGRNRLLGFFLQFSNDTLPGGFAGFNDTPPEAPNSRDICLTSAEPSPDVGPESGVRDGDLRFQGHEVVLSYRDPLQQCIAIRIFDDGHSLPG